MRILIANNFFYLKGGAERCTFLLDELLRRSGHETCHFAVRDPRNEPSPWSHHFPASISTDRPVWHPESWKAAARSFGVGVRRKLRALVREAKPEVAILHNTYHHLGRPMLMRELVRSGVPVVCILHDYQVVCPAHSLFRDGEICQECSGGAFHRAAWHGCGGSRMRGMHLALEACFQRPRYRECSLFLAPSHFLIEKVREMGFPHEVSFLRNFYPASETKVDPVEGRAVGYAGRLSPEKGLDVLLEAARRLPSIPFRIAGGGPMEEGLRHRRPENVTLLGQLDREELEQERRGWRLAVV
ncbi:MAG: glycosyltransferase, partial [Thermoanaerobaculia bacterium]|nr:glycosyltransferase [Thermoanaerobaculia bacterium]